MQNGAKIHLSTQEMELVTNKEWLFLKRKILQKMEVFFGELHRKFSDLIDKEPFILEEGLKNQGGKISKGENYKGLPYMILDYPAKFSRDNVFAVRTLFWWGNFFSISLHLSGKYLSISRKAKEGLSFLQDRQFHIHSGNDEWDHDLNESGYQDVNELNADQYLEIFKNNYFKISKKINLSEFENAPKLLEIAFGEIMEFVEINSRQYDEKVL